MERNDVTRILPREAYTVGWLCPIPVELTAARGMLDEEHGRVEVPSNDKNTYAAGRMGPHNVVIGCLPLGQQGLTPASVLGERMLSTFPNLQLKMLVGIAGGVPSAKADIRLGDVVVSAPDGVGGGVLQYDLGKSTIEADNSVVRKVFKRKGHLDSIPSEWLSAMSSMQADHDIRSNRISEHIDDMIQRRPGLDKFRRPLANDVLFPATYPHLMPGDSCENCGCDRNQAIQRRDRGFPVLHYGTVASGNRVKKDAEERDRISEELGGAKCFDMEAAGLMNDFKCAVVRGIADYADSHKNDDWHRYAAATAAAAAKELLAYMPELGKSERPASPTSNKRVKSLLAEHDRAKLLRWLEQAEQTSAPLPSPSPGTGEWFLRTRQYQDWVSVGGSAMLWCAGAPGTGKSMLASIAIRNLMSRPHGSAAIVAYYFCDFAAQQQQNMVTVLQSLLLQIVAHTDAQHLPTLVHLQAKARQTSDVYVLSDMLKTVCEGAQNLFVVFDAPDELADPGPTLAFLGGLAAKGTKILVTSRDLSSGLAKHLSGATKLRIEAAADDIVKFVEGELQNAEIHGNGQSVHELVVAIAGKANGLFLLARIFVDELLQTTTIKKMRKALEAMPTHLAQAYDKSLKRIEAQPRERRQLAQRAISWITHARRRFAVQELQHALALDEEDDELDGDNIPNIDLLIRVCAGIIVANADGRVGMVHTTAYEFFRERCAAGSLGEIGKTSLHYLRLRVFREEGPCQTLNGLNERISRMPFLPYAATYCAEHIHEDQMEKTLLESSLGILRDENLRLTAFQAIHHKRRFKNRQLAEEFFGSMPRGQNDLHVAAYWNLSHALEILLGGTRNLSQRDSQGLTALHWACCQRSSAAIKTLVAAGASLSDQDPQGWTPLFWSAFKCDSANVEYLLQNGAQCDAKDVHGWTALTWATLSASSERHAVVKELLLHYQKSCTSGSILQSEPPLDLADARGDADLFKVLLARGEDLDLSIEQFWSAGEFDVPVANVWRAAHKGESMFGVQHSFGGSGLLDCAIKDGKRTIMRVLLELGAPVNAWKPDEKRSPLHWAAFKEDPRFVEDLIDAGADVDQLDEYGQTALHQAVLNGFIKTAGVLIKAHSDVNSYRRRFSDLEYHPKQTPLMLACGLALDKRRDTRIISGGGRSRSVEPSDGCGSALEMVSLLLASGADPHAKDGDNRSVMHYAVMSSQVEVVKRLVTAGATFDGRSEEGVTLWHEAAKVDLDIFDLVTNAEPDVEVVDIWGGNIFHYLALMPRHPAVPKERLVAVLDALISKCGVAMLNAGCQKPGCTSSIAHGEHVHEGATPLSLTFDVGNWPLAAVFYERGAVLPPAFQTSTWLRPAIYYRSLVGVRLLLKLGVRPGEVRWKSFPGLNEITSEELSNFGSIVKELINAGLDVNKPMNASYGPPEEDPDPVQSMNYDTILSTAAAHVNDESFIQLLLELGADPRIPGKDNMDSFCIAALCMNYNTLETLLKHTAAVPAYSTHWAFASTSFPNEDSVNRLCKAIRQHGEINRVWKSMSSHLWRYRTLLHMASERRNSLLVSALLSAGADPNLPEHDIGFTALHHAALVGDSNIAQSLIEAGADVNATASKWPYYGDKPPEVHSVGDTWQGTPLQLAVMNGRVDVRDLLLANGAET